MALRRFYMIENTNGPFSFPSLLRNPTRPELSFGAFSVFVFIWTRG